MTIKAVVFDAYGTLYDTHSVESTVEQAFPDRGELITQLWRIKQLEYSWLRSLMGTYQDFGAMTRDALVYTLECLGLAHDAAVLDRLFDSYQRLEPYPEAAATLEALHGVKRAILSNGSPAMLSDLTKNSGFDRLLDDVISVDAAKTFKPSPKTYALVGPRLDVEPDEVLFVSSNPWDVAGAKAFGFNVAWIERVPRDIMHRELAQTGPLPAPTFYKALRTQMDVLGHEPDHRIASLSPLVDIVRG